MSDHMHMDDNQDRSFENIFNWNYFIRDHIHFIPCLSAPASSGTSSLKKGVCRERAAFNIIF